MTNTQELQNWINSLYFKIEEENFKDFSWDAPFIADYEMKNDDFIIMVTTKNSLQNIIKQDLCGHSLIVLDGTYNLNEPGYPTIVVGTIDLHKKFHLGNTLSLNLINLLLVAYVITTTENESTYYNVHKFLDKSVKSIFPDFHLNFSFQMADEAQYIRTAAKRWNPDINILLCKFHFWQAVHPKLYSKELVPELNSDTPIPPKFKQHFNIMKSSSRTKTENKVRDIIKFDIRILELLPSKELYMAYLKISIPFWKHFALKFYEYFWKTYLDFSNNNCLSGWQNWVKGTQPGTNNALEGINHSIKRDVTENKKLKFGEYLESLVEDLVEKSEVSGKIPSFPKTPIIPLAILKLSYKLNENFEEYFLQFEGKYYVKDKFISYSFYGTNTGKIKKEINRLATKVSRENEEAVNKFLSYYSKPTIIEVQRMFKYKELKGKLQILSVLPIRQVTINHHEDKEKILLNSFCTCPDFFRNYTCHHLIACLRHDELFNPNISFVAKKPRGRPRKN